MIGPKRVAMLPMQAIGWQDGVVYSQGGKHAGSVVQMPGFLNFLDLKGG
jgi:hypothetical protein